MTCFLLLFFFFFFFFSVAGSGYYGVEFLYRIILIKKTRLFFNSLNVRSENQSFNNSVVLGSLAICVQAHH